MNKEKAKAHKYISFEFSLGERIVQTIGIQPFIDQTGIHVMVSSTRTHEGHSIRDKADNILDERIIIPLNAVDEVVKSIVEMKDYVKRCGVIDVVKDIYKSTATFGFVHKDDDGNNEDESEEV